MSYQRHFLILLVILFIKVCFAISFIQQGSIGLGPDEAQYWTWSQDLSLGYYSKPPGIAWQIWLGTNLFGNTELGVRFGAIIVGALLSLATFSLARACGLKPETSFWAGLIMAFSPLGILASFLAITDGSMVLFWTLACCVMASALREHKPPAYWMLGLLILCGALFKWTMYYFWVVVFVSMVFYPFLFSWNFLAGLAISLLGLVPSLVWNSEHDWVTFRHVFSTIQGGPAYSTHSQSNFWAFFGEQVVLLSPLLFILLGISLVRTFSQKLPTPPSLKFCGWVFAGFIGVFWCLSFFKKMQGNWCDFAYPPGIVFLCWFMCEHTIGGKRWLQAGVALSILLCGFLFSIPYMQAHGIKAFGEIPYKFNPFRHNVGWDHLRKVLDDNGYNPNNNFLFGDKYQTTSLLSFYGEGQKRAYFFNLNGIRHNQFSFWPGMEKEQQGKTGYFVLTENVPAISAETRKKYQTLLQDYFHDVRLIAVQPLFYSDGRPVKMAMVFLCTGYNGKIPAETELF